LLSDRSNADTRARLVTTREAAEQARSLVKLDGQH
jgi:hypothetical protein